MSNTVATEIEIREYWSTESLSVQFWYEAIDRVKDCAGTADNVLFVARDSGSLIGLRKHHGEVSTGFTAVPPEKARLFYDLGMKFRFAFLIHPTREIINGITPIVTEVLTIVHPHSKGDRN